MAHRNDDPANPIRVINLSYGTGGNPAYETDPVQYAVEQAWKAGIVVVVAAGNFGNGTAKLTNPANDPYVIAVGSAGTKGTTAPATTTLSTFTNLATDYRGVDIARAGRVDRVAARPGFQHRRELPHGPGGHDPVQGQRHLAGGGGDLGGGGAAAAAPADADPGPGQAGAQGQRHPDRKVGIGARRRDSSSSTSPRR